ncbi:cell wall-binding repeat-containing protein [Clostridium sp. ATCC 25772]|uniref:cell wall-binding repeat-containing protein n=1 Tax=Clostridium sp. ATCC 25772 TaxID=1676991 RepID=UPI0007842052|nr:cell wall-binding repeat-containing protein [Clostridium sp. ATCC 25772]
MKKSSRVVSTLLLGATVASASTGVFAVESKEIIQDKLAGETRFETAVKVSEKFGKTDTVVLVNYTGIADALAATPLAKMKNAPILLTEAGSLTKATADQIAKLEAKKVIVIGGETAVSKNVVKQLEELKLDVERVAGEDRYATSEAVANEMGKDGKVEKVAVVNGIKGLADALSVAAPAAKEGMAIVLSDGTSVRAGQKVLDEAKTKYVIGGETVVSKELTEKLDAERLAGANRNATNAEVLNKFYDAKELDKVYVAKDGAAKENQLVDALAAGPLAGKEGNPLVLAGSELDKAQEAYLKDRIAKSLVEVGEGINQNTVSAIVKALTVKEETPSDKAEVTGVTVLNADQIEVKFSQKVDKDSAEISDNYTIKDDDGNDIKDKYVKDKETGFKVEVSEDSKTVVLTLNQKYQKTDFRNQETIRVKVENVMTEDKSEVFEKYENKNVRLFDNTLPELKGIKQVGPKDFDLVFSEPVTAENNSELLSAIRINNGSYNFNAETRIENEDLAPNVVRIKTATELKDGEYDFTIKENKIMDYAGLKLEAIDRKLSVKKDETPLTASVYKVNGHKVTLKFNKEVENAEHYFDENDKEKENKNVDYYLDYANNDAFKAIGAKMVDGKLEVEFDKPIPTGDHKIVVVYDNENDDKVQDLWEQELSSKEISFNVAKDTVAPTATISYDKKDKNVIEVKFSEEVTGADKEAAYELKDSKGNYVTIKTIEQKKENKLVYRLFLDKDLDGNYDLKIKGNKIFDTSVEKNEFKEKVFDLATLDQTPATVTSVTCGGKDKDKKDKIYVEFSEEMKTSGEGSILDKKLYSINETNLDDIEDAKIELNNNLSVIITMPEDDVEDSYKVVVGRVCDANGNFAGVGGTLGVREATDDAKIELINGTKLNEKDVLEKKYSANIISDEEVEVFIKGRIIAADASKITLDTQKCEEVNREVLNLEQASSDDNVDGKDLIVTKVTLKFDEDTFNTQGDQTIANLVFDDDAFTTALESKTSKLEIASSKEIESLKADDKAEADYKDDSAVIIKEKNDAKQIRIELTEAVKPVTKSTFKIEGFEVNSVDSVDDGSTGVVLLNVKSRQFTEEKPNVRVEQKEAIYDLKDNKTTGMSFSIKKVDTFAGLALAKINAGTATLEDYKTAGVTGVTDANLTEVNAKVKEVKEADKKDLTLDQVKGIVDAIEKDKVEAEAEAAVKAAEEASLKSKTEIETATTLATEAKTAVEKVTDTTNNQAFTKRINAVEVKIDTAKANANLTKLTVDGKEATIGADKTGTVKAGTGIELETQIAGVAKIVKVNDVVIAESDLATKAVVENDVITVIVTAIDGTTIGTYTITAQA